jgi:hypothetical protein
MKGKGKEKEREEKGKGRESPDRLSRQIPYLTS